MTRMLLIFRGPEMPLRNIGYGSLNFQPIERGDWPIAIHIYLQRRIGSPFGTFGSQSLE